MILPSKHLSQERALLTVGARVLQQLQEPKTVSALWEEFPRFGKKDDCSSTPMSYDGFVLALDLLFLMGTIELEDGLLARKSI